MIIDIRMNYSQYDAFGRPYGIPGILSTMDKYGIDKAILISTMAVNVDFALGNKELYEAVASNDGLFAYLTVNPNYTEETIQLMRSVMNNKKFVAAAFFIGSSKPYPNADDYREILKAYRRFGKPVFLNTPHRIAVEAAEEMAKEFPTIKFIYGSMGGNEWQRAISNNKQLNVYLETSGSFDAEKIDSAMANLGPHRIFYGSNSPYSDPASMIGLIKSSKLSEDAAAKVFASNAEKFFNLNQDESELDDIAE